MLNPQTFGKLISFNLKKNCDSPVAVYVPIRLSVNSASPGALVLSEQIDLSSFIRGNPAPFMSGIQSLIAYQNTKDSTGNLINASFGSEFLFNNGFKCWTPGRAYTALTVISDNTPVINLNVYSIGAISSATDCAIDLYFGNFPIDQTHFSVL